LLALTAATPWPGPAAAASARRPRAQLTDFVCVRALDPPNRSVSARAVMRPLAGTRRLELKFDLLTRRRAGAAMQSVVRAGDLGVWISPSNPTLGQLPGDVWNFDKSVVDLRAPAGYELRVAFRWIGAHRRVISSEVRYSPRCREPELRPDLLVRSITVTAIAGHPGEELYSAVIRNAGASAAGPFSVLFAPGDGSAPKRHTVGLLPAYTSRVEQFVGPLCTAASAPTVTVDSAGQVDDLNRTNNQLTAACPAAKAASARRYPAAKTAPASRYN